MKKQGESSSRTQLRAERLHHQWSQQELAERIGTSVVTINRWERGVTAPSPYYRLKLCALFGKSDIELGLRTEPAQSLHTPAIIAPAPVALDRHWSLPFRRNPFFSGRTVLLDELHMHFQSHSQHVIALSGLGGIGKSQTAIEYAYRYRTDYRTVLWLRAESPEILRRDYTRLARDLHLPAAESPEQLSTNIKDWLTAHQHWLLILDNIEEMALAEQILPFFFEGHVLLTTRLQATGPLARHIDIQQLNLQESRTLLIHRASNLASDETTPTLSTEAQQAVTELSQLLDGMPLALDQAGAYIEETSCRFVDYLERYHQQRLVLLNRRGTHHMQHPASVVATITLCIEQIAHGNPLATTVLRFCAFLPAEGITTELLQTGITLVDTASAQAEQKNAPFEFDRAIADLRTLSLLYRDTSGTRFTIHRLVQDVLRETLDYPEQVRWATYTIQLINTLFPAEALQQNIQHSEQLLPYADLCKQWIKRWELTSLDTYQLLTKAGRYLLLRAHYSRAEAFLSLALHVLQSAQPQSAAELATTWNALGSSYEAQGRYAQAEAAYQQAATHNEQTSSSSSSSSSPPNPTYIETLHNLGRVALQQNRYAQAQSLLERVVILCEQHSENQFTYLSSLQLLALLHHQSGHHAPAQAMLNRALRYCQRVFGATHPYSIEYMGQLSLLYSMHQQDQQARALYQQCTHLLAQTVASGYELTASCLKMLGEMYGMQGEVQQAETLLRQALAITQHSVGSKHPDTAECLSALATLARQQGHYQQAESLLLRASEILKSYFGPTHPHTTEIAIALGVVYGLAAKYQQAAELLQTTSDLLAHAPAEAALSYSECLCALASIQQLQGHTEQARELLIQTLAQQEQILGEGDPRIATTLFHLGSLERECQQFQRATQYAQRSLAIRTQIFGLEHPALLETLELVACVSAENGHLRQDDNSTKN